MKIAVNALLMARHRLILRQRGATAFPDPLEAVLDPTSINFGPIWAQNVGFAGLPGLRGQKVFLKKENENKQKEHKLEAGRSQGSAPAGSFLDP